MKAVRIETTVLPNRRVIIEDLPFDEGKNVEVIVLETNGSQLSDADPYPLHGTEYEYDDPFSPLISFDDWKPVK